MNRRDFTRSSLLLAAQSLGAAGSLLAFDPAPQSPVSAGQPPSSDWTLIPEISDEFSGTSLDATKWKIETGYPGSGPFAFSPKNVTVSGGRLNLTARKEDLNGKPYTAAFLESKISDPGNGSYVEVRARPIDFRANICCAIWEQNFPLGEAANPNPEIDIQEYMLGKIGIPERVASTLHRWPTKPGVHTMDATQTYDALRPLYYDFHTYGLERRDGKLRFYLDGFKYWEYNVASMPEFVTMPRHVIFSLEGHAGNPVDAFLPAAFQIDYLRIYRYNGPAGGSRNP
jgi:beta-glucanase (GH16 family)